nr:MAG TPA: hypothetical protein [Caudoviricetes sp.]
MKRERIYWQSAAKARIEQSSTTKCLEIVRTAVTILHQDQDIVYSLVKAKGEQNCSASM